MAYVEIFDVVDGKLTPTKHCYALPFLKNIMDEYPDDYIDIYKYVFYMTCPYPKHNPFFNVAHTEKEAEILRHIKLKVSLDNALIEVAKGECSKLFNSRMAQAYEAMAVGVEKVSAYMITTTITDGRDSNLNALLKAIKDYPKMRESFEKVESAFLESQKETSVRGQATLAYDESKR